MDDRHATRSRIRTLFKSFSVQTSWVTAGKKFTPMREWMRAAEQSTSVRFTSVKLDFPRHLGFFRGESGQIGQSGRAGVGMGKIEQGLFAVRCHGRPRVRRKQFLNSLASPLEDVPRRRIAESSSFNYARRKVLLCPEQGPCLLQFQEVACQSCLREHRRSQGFVAAA